MTATKKTLHIAWTIDDGPTPHTPAMVKNFSAPNRPATWYIVRDRLNSSNLSMYHDLQAAGHEIAIHGLHTSKNHLSWFPGTDQTKPSYNNMGDALNDLISFHDYLVKNGLKIKFVRVPYGLQTELIYNLKNAGMSSATAKDANKIINNQVRTNDSHMYHIVNNNLKSLKTTLASLNLQLWGGSSTGAISRQSWEAESAASGTGRTDDVPKRQISYMRDVLDRKPSKTGSFVILCHDTTAKDAKEVETDIAAMEAAAAKYDTQIVYHTMSSLYKTIVKKNP